MASFWTTAELNRLFDLTGDVPWPLVVQRYNQWASENGFPERTELALKLRCEMEGVSRRCLGQYIDLGSLAQLLGVSWPTVRRWVMHHRYIRCYRIGQKRYVNRSQLQQLARHVPEHFHGKPFPMLLALFNSERLAKRYSELPPLRQHGTPRPVRGISDHDQIEFDSIVAAARAVYVCPQAIRQSISRGYQAAGYHWQYSDCCDPSGDGAAAAVGAAA